MHLSARHHARQFFENYTQNLIQPHIIEIGSQDVNGSLRDLAPADAKYVGLDFVNGRGVDIVIEDPYALPVPDNSADIVLSSSCMEHSEMFWLLFLEMARIVKPGGLIYLNAPSNGMFHRYPVDCWRFYPDSGAALQTWAQRNNQPIQMLESFIGPHDSNREIWNDFVAIYTKEPVDTQKYPRRMIENNVPHFNGRLLNDPQPVNHQLFTEDQRKLQDSHRRIEELYDSIDTFVLNQRKNNQKESTPTEEPTNIQPTKKEPSIAQLKTKREFYRLLGMHRKVERYAQKILKAKEKLAAPPPGPLHFGILTPPHTLFLAHAIARCLAELGFASKIYGPDECETFDASMYFVLCPQIFKNLPPGERRISFQLEQTINDRWFTKKYITTLEESRAVIDYSQTNLKNLTHHNINYPHTYHVSMEPIDLYNPYGIEKISDSKDEVIFYGDINNERRKRIISELSKHFKIATISNVFGPELHKALKSARAVINLHYYEGALLETPRICECLSLNLPVISEGSPDQDDYPELKEAVRFVATDDVSGMIRELNAALAAPRPDYSRLQQRGMSRFRFMFGRVLLGQRLISLAQFQNIEKTDRLASETICLSLPETADRRQLVKNERPWQAKIFDGLRQSPGWIGCGMSYKYLCAKAHDEGLPSILIYEDDAIVETEAQSKLEKIRKALEADPYSWDIFAGMISHLHPNTEIIDARMVDGIQMITIDRMTSTVCNIYGRRAMKILSQWDEKDINPKSNTIDRFIENYPGLRIVTTLPFMASHRGDTNSTLWGFQNTQYDSLILESEKLLQIKVNEFLATRQQTENDYVKPTPQTVAAGGVT